MLLKDKIIIILASVFIMIGIYFFGFQFGKISQKNNEKYNYDSEKTPYYYHITFNMDIKDEQKNQGLVSLKVITTLDENDICINSRALWTFKTREIANETYKNWQGINENVTINSNSVAFNDTTLLGKTKDEIIANYNQVVGTLEIF